MAQIDMKKTGENIKEMRLRRNISVKELQEALYLEAPQSVYKWQQGKSLPTLDNLVDLADLFNVKIEDIIVLTK